MIEPTALPLDEKHPALLRSRRRRFPTVISLIVLVVLAGIGGAYAWANLGPFLRSFSQGGSDRTEDVGDKSIVPDLLASQLKISDDLETQRKSIADQHEQIKALLDRLTALTSKVDAMQSPTAAVAPKQAPVQISPVVAMPKKPAAPRPARPVGSVSTGGAPLPLAPGTGPQ